MPELWLQFEDIVELGDVTRNAKGADREPKEHLDEVEVLAFPFGHEVIEAVAALALVVQGFFCRAVKNWSGGCGDRGCFKYDPPRDKVVHRLVQDHSLGFLRKIFEELDVLLREEFSHGLDKEVLGGLLLVVKQDLPV